ncbi:BOI-related E3 ubiquitin-protein ligase 1-like [Oryza brachyantha]|nr:BOI-related E3 ubiquitin-protein ligase 1-like [Oryza brachyantha]
MDGKMFGGGNWGSFPYPSITKESQFLFDGKATPMQLQLFGGSAVPAVGSVGYHNYIANNHLSAMNQERNTNNDVGHEKLLNLQMSLNNFPVENAGRFARIGNPSAVSTGLRLSSDNNEHTSITSGNGSMPSIPVMASFVDEVMTELDKENKEFNYYFELQVQQLFKCMKEVNQRQTVEFLASLERGVGKKLKEKELELEAMNKKSKELNEQIRQVALEVQSWQSVALHNQSIANSLKSKLMQMVAQSSNLTREGSGDSEVDNSASSQNINAVPGGFFQSGLLGTNSMADGVLGSCRLCRTKEAALLVMPCRHLCLCADCDKNADVCPVCRFPKSCSVEINMS